MTKHPWNYNLVTTSDPRNKLKLSGELSIISNAPFIIINFLFYCHCCRKIQQFSSVPVKAINPSLLGMLRLFLVETICLFGSFLDKILIWLFNIYLNKSCQSKQIIIITLLGLPYLRNRNCVFFLFVKWFCLQNLNFILWWLKNGQ